jgi:hypothetical protein
MTNDFEVQKKEDIKKKLKHNSEMFKQLSDLQLKSVKVCL